MKASYIMGVTRSTWLAQAIDSVLQQTVDDIELIVSCRREDFKHVPTDVRVRTLLRTTDNGAKNANELIACARSDYILPMADDDLAMPTRTRDVLELLDQGADICTCSYLKIDIDGVQLGVEYAQPFDFEAYVHRGLNMSFLTGGFRRSTAPQWDEHLDHLADYGWFLDAYRLGLKIVTSRDVTLKVRQHPGQQSRRMDDEPKALAEKRAELDYLEGCYGVRVNR